MNTEQVIARTRRLISQVDLETSEYADEDLLTAIDDARRPLAVMGLAGMLSLAVQPAKSEPNYGVLPAPSDYQGELLALCAAVELLNRAYRGRLDRGELGVSWTSGMEAESSIAAGKAYRDSIEVLRRQADSMLLAVDGRQANARMQ